MEFIDDIENVEKFCKTLKKQDLLIYGTSHIYLVYGLAASGKTTFLETKIAVSDDENKFMYCSKYHPHIQVSPFSHIIHALENKDPKLKLIVIDDVYIEPDSINDLLELFLKHPDIVFYFSTHSRKLFEKMTNILKSKN